jgi:ABC-type branched-subunit amino acid transport system ATPase component
LGITFLIIEHNLAMVERLCNTVIVMALGRVIAEGSMAELRENPAVVDAYLGEG